MDDLEDCAACGSTGAIHDPRTDTDEPCLACAVIVRTDPNVMPLEPGEAGWLGTSGWADRYTGGRY